MNVRDLQRLKVDAPADEKELTSYAAANATSYAAANATSYAANATSYAANPTTHAVQR